LPAFKGLHTHRQALQAGVAEHGCSVHYVTAELDGGPVVSQARVPVLSGDDEPALAARVLGREHPLLVATLRLLASRRVQLGASGVLLDGEPLAAPVRLLASRPVQLGPTGVLLDGEPHAAPLRLD